MNPRAAVAVLALLLSSFALFAQQPPARQDTTTAAPAETAQVQPPPAQAAQADEAAWEIRDYIALGALVLSLVGFAFGIYQYRRRLELNVRRQAQKIQTAEDAYRDSLRDELGSISLLGSPDVPYLPVNLINSLVSLDLSERWHSESAQVLGEQREMLERERDYPPEKAIAHAITNHKARLLLIIGDPGSGKTTLLKYYALKCLDGKSGELGFDGPHMPIYLPLRDVDPDKSLAANLAEREKTRPRPLAEADIDVWLAKRDTLILLDGLDEISKVADRIAICRWIEAQCRDFRKAFFVVTSRWTGYRKADGIELEIRHLRADVRDFSPDQQREFLQKWFDAVYLSEDFPDGEPDATWRRQRLTQARLKAQAIIDYLGRAENESLRHLAAIPMLLQIMAIIWKEQEYLPRSRATLYNVVLNYLLEHRDRHRKLDPILSAEHARSVLAPAALWMQEELHAEEVEKDALHARLQTALDEMEEQPKAKDFCENLRDRAGVIADYGTDQYIFRHKSFREYLAGMQLAELFHEDGRLTRLVEAFGDDWWEEPLRFFISKPNGELFDGFMRELFRSPKSRQLSDKQQTLLQLLVQEAGQRKLDALLAHLNNPKATEEQRRYILDCLKTIGTDQALEAMLAYCAGDKAAELMGSLRDFFAHRDDEKLANEYFEPIYIFLTSQHFSADDSFDYAQKILREHFIDFYVEVSESRSNIFQTRPKSFHNPIEYNAEYILIPGGTITDIITSEIRKIPYVFFAKYPVTNRQYRRFIRYLQGMELEIEKIIPHNVFSDRLFGYASNIDGFVDYLNKNKNSWPKMLISRYDNDRRFNHDDQPVVGVTWYAARAYCFWLSTLTTTQSNADNSALLEANSAIFRLPYVVEWERTARGRLEYGPQRTYPWGNSEPHERLANYGRLIGQTVPVGRYPDGATPEGVYDLAGNVWEWMEDEPANETIKRGLRGGSWNSSAESQQADGRYSYAADADRNDIGFRVIYSDYLPERKPKKPERMFSVSITSGGGMLTHTDTKLEFSVINHNPVTLNEAHVTLQPSADYNIKSQNTIKLKQLAPNVSQGVSFVVQARVSREITFNMSVNDEMIVPAIRLYATEDIPYVYGNPIQNSKNFFGRQSELNEIMQAVFKPNKQDILLVGERRSGKTSLLYQLQNSIYSPFIAIYIVLNEGPRDVAGMIRKIVRKIIITLLGREVLLINPWSRYEPEHTNLTDNLVPIMDAAREKLPDLKLVLLLDEGDFLLEMDVIMQNILRGALQASSLGESLRTVVAGTSKLSSYFSKESSPFFNHFKFVPLLPLNYSEIKNLVTTPAEAFHYRYDHPAVDKIYAACGGHPYYCQRICYEVFTVAIKDNKDVIDLDLCAKAIQNVVKSPSDDAFQGFKKYFWDAAIDEERSLMKRIVESRKRILVNRTIPKRLLDWQILVEKDGTLDFSALLFREWVKRLIGNDTQ